MAIEPAQVEVRSGVFCVGIALAMIAAGWVRFSGLTENEMWLDEVCTYYCVKHWDSWPADGPDRDREVTHRAYLFALRGWTKLAGNDAWGLRSFSAAVGVATVGFLGLAAGRLTGRVTGIVTSGLAAVHPLHIHYSREARGYALWCLIVTLLLYCLIRAGQRLRWGWWAGYAAAAWLAIMAHDYTVFLLPATAAAVLIAADKRRFLLQWLAVHLTVGFLSAASMWGFVQTQIGGGSKAWIAREWEAYPPWAAVPKSLWAMLPSGGYPEYLGALSNATGWSGVVLVGVLLTWVLGRKTGRKLSELRVGLTATAISLGFLVIAWAFSLTVYPAYVVGRYDLAAWPGIMMGVGSLVVAAGRCVPRRGARRAVTVGVTVTLMACSVSTVRAVRSIPARNDLAERARRMAAVVQSGGLLVSAAIYRWFMLYEWDRIGFAPTVISFPPEHDRQLGWEDAASELKRPEVIAGGVESVVVKIERALEAGQRVWLIAQGKPEGARWEVDRQLFTALRLRGLEITPVDEWLGLARVERRER